MHYKQLIDTEFLGQWDLQHPETGALREVTVAIENVERYVPTRERKKKVRGADGVVRWELERNTKIKISFVGKRKRWLCGRKNQDVIAAMYGNDIRGWKGKKITLFVDPEVMFGKKKTGGIVVRARIPGSNVDVTPDALDNPVDEELAQRIAEAYEDFAGGDPEEAEAAPDPKAVCHHDILRADCPECTPKKKAAK